MAVTGATAGTKPGTERLTQQKEVNTTFDYDLYNQLRHSELHFGL